jgi:phosphate transport system substrate-binding protein
MILQAVLRLVLPRSSNFYDILKRQVGVLDLAAQELAEFKNGSTPLTMHRECSHDRRRLVAPGLALQSIIDGLQMSSSHIQVSLNLHNRTQDCVVTPLRNRFMSAPSLVTSFRVWSMRACATVGAIGLVAALQASEVELDPKIPAYTTVEGVSGNINSIGSDTLNNLMTFWAEGFATAYPIVNVQIEGKGSTTAPPALIEGTAQLGPMSREMKKDEIDAFEKKYGYKPTQVKVCIDALAVFVHKDNPLTSLTMAQVDGLFSSTFKHGGKEIKNWGSLGLTGAWATKPISLYGRNSASGTYGYFKEVALKKGDYKSSVKEQPGSSGVVQGVSSDLASVGYSGHGYLTAGVKALPLGESADKLVDGSYANCLNGTYPLSRFLFVYVNKVPGRPLDTLTLEFLKFVLSKDGQDIVVKDGYYPLTAEAAAQALADLSK